MKKTQRLQREAVRNSGTKQRLTDFSKEELQLVSGSFGPNFCAMTDPSSGQVSDHFAYPADY